MLLTLLTFLYRVLVIVIFWDEIFWFIRCDDLGVDKDGVIKIPISC